MVMRSNDAHQNDLHTLSDLAAVAPHLRMGVGYEFLERADGYQGLVSTYGLRFAESPRVMDLGLLYRALESKQVDIVAGSNTDGLIEAVGLVVLEDDRHYFPAYKAVPIVRWAVVKAFPKVSTTLDLLSGQIVPKTCDISTMRSTGRRRMRPRLSPVFWPNANCSRNTMRGEF